MTPAWKMSQLKRNPVLLAQMCQATNNLTKSVLYASHVRSQHTRPANKNTTTDMTDAAFHVASTNSIKEIIVGLCSLIRRPAD